MKLKVQNAKRKTTTQNLKVLTLTLSLCVLTFALYPSPTYAACTSGTEGIKIGDCFGFGDFTSLGAATSKIVDPIFSLAAVMVILYFLWGALKYMTSKGNKEEVAAARGMITHAIIGFIILMFAFLILQFLLSSLFGIRDFQIIG